LERSPDSKIWRRWSRNPTETDDHWKSGWKSTPHSSSKPMYVCHLQHTPNSTRAAAAAL